MNNLEIIDGISFVTYDEFMLKIDSENLKYLLVQKVCNSFHNPPRWFLENKEIYTLDTNSNKKRLIDILMKQKVKKYNFKNDIIFDFRMENITIKSKNTINFMGKSFNVIEKINGIVKKTGKSAGIEKNPIYKIIFNNKPLYLMFCEVDTFTIIDFNQINKIREFDNKKVTWYLLKNGYIGGHVKINSKKTIIYLHQHLMDHYGNGLKNGVMSVDHINTDKLDNRLDNLRLVDQSEQNKNRSKRKRQKSAKCDLPDFIEELPKYVQYIDSRGGYFCIRNHPNYPDEYYQSTTRKDVSLQEKYQSTLNKLKEYNDKNINNNIDNKTADSNTGIKYITKTTLHGNECYYFDTKLDGTRYTKKKSNISIKDFQQLILASFPDIRKNLEQEWNIKLITNENDTEKTIDYYKSKLPKYFSLYQEKKRNKDEYVWIISYNRKENDKRITFRKTLPKLNESHVTIAIDLLNNKINK